MTLGALRPRLRVWQVLLLAFAARVAVGLANDGVLHPDEIMQYLEQAHRLVFGAGMVPWEDEYGLRPWALPLALAVPLRLLALVGLDTPAVVSAGPRGRAQRGEPRGALLPRIVSPGRCSAPRPVISRSCSQPSGTSS